MTAPAGIVRADGNLWSPRLAHPHTIRLPRWDFVSRKLPTVRPPQDVDSTAGTVTRTLRTVENRFT